jgi:hypothetical protein
VSGTICYLCLGSLTIDDAVVRRPGATDCHGSTGQLKLLSHLFEAWKRSKEFEWLDREAYISKIQPRLVSVAISTLRSALRISERYAALIRLAPAFRIRGIGKHSRGLLVSCPTGEAVEVVRDHFKERRRFERLSRFRSWPMTVAPSVLGVCGFSPREFSSTTPCQDRVAGSHHKGL